MGRHSLGVWLVMGILLGSAYADPLDDFANNLISDLAPYHHDSSERDTSRRSHVVKAIIGRAAENRAAVELDLMSSTSQEVCELYNGQSIVKCPGKGQVWEYICLIPKNRDSESRNIDERIVFRTLEQATEGKTTNDKVWTLQPGPKESKESSDDTPTAISTATEWKIRRPWFLRQKRNSPRPISSESAAERGFSSQGSSVMTVIRNTSPEAPNISLNLGKYHDRTAITIVAVIGTILQIGILIFFAMITYYPKIQPTFKKDDNSAPRHAFPLTASGSMILVTGLLICCHVVENSTTETRYESPEGYEMRTYWIQRSHTVSDQVFASFAMYSSNTQTVLLTSRRLKPSIGGTANEWVKWKTVIGVLLGVAGFFLQFIGLRAMSSAASLAQLGAVVFMTITRALVRSEFSKSLRTVRLGTGSELDWLAGELLTHEVFSDTHLPTSEFETRHGSSVPNHADGPKQRTQSTSAELNQQKPSLTETRSWAVDVSKQSLLRVIRDAAETPSATQLLVARRELGKLAKYQGKTSKVAVNLALVMEEACNVFLGLHSFPFDVEGLVWTPKVNHDFPYNRKGAKGKGKQVEFDLRLYLDINKRSWTILADDVDAALSLWVATALRTDDNKLEPEELDFSNVGQDNDGWLRGQVAGDDIRVLGPISTFGDVRLFEPDHVFEEYGSRFVTLSNAGEASEAEEIEANGGEGEAIDFLDSIKVEPSRLVGCRWFLFQAVEEHLPPVYETEFYSEHPLRSIAMGVKTQDSLEIRFAKDLLFAFMSSIAATMGPLHCEIDRSPQAPRFDVKLNTGPLHLGDLTEKFVKLGFGSSLEAACTILVPLSLAGKLPSYEIFRKICSDARSSYETLWESAYFTFWEETFLALEILYSGYKNIGFGWMLTLLVSSIHDIDSIITTQQREGLETSILVDVLLYLNNQLRLFTGDRNQEFLSRLRQVYSAQGQNVRLSSETDWFCEKLKEALRPEDVAQQLRDMPTYSAEYASFFELSNTHMKVIRNEELDYDDVTEGAHSRDILGATPLHYAAFVPKSASTVKRLLDPNGEFDANDAFRTEGAKVYAEDLHGYSPLHYGFGYGDWETVRHLCICARNTSRWGLLGKVKQGTDGASPMHVAAARNNTPVIRECLEDATVVPHRGWSFLDFQGRTPLHWAIVAGHIQVVEVLWNHGYDDDVAIDPVDKHGWKSIHVAVLHNKADIVKRLCELSADISEKDNDGRTPLALASKNGRLEAARVLLDHILKDQEAKEAGQIINATDNDGNTPLHLSRLNGTFEIENELLRAGADWDIQNAQGQTAHEIRHQEEH